MTETLKPTLPLRQRIMRAGTWAIAGHMSAQVLRLASNLIMTRLLVPDLFGLMALINAIVVIVTMLGDIGIRQTVVQSKRGDSHVMLDTAWVMEIMRGTGIWVICILIALAIGLMQRYGVFAATSVYAAPDLPLLIAVATFTAVIHSFASTNMFLAERSLDQKPVAVITVLSLVATIVSMIIMASFSKTIWPLVFGSFFGETVFVLLSHFWLPGHRVKARLDASCAKEILTMGRWIAASSTMHILSYNGDRLMLAAWATQSQLALYYIALTLAQAVDTIAGRVFSAVATPALSEVLRRDPAQLRQAYWKLRKRTDAAIGAASGFLVAMGDSLVRVLYDSRYHEAGIVLQILAFGLIFTRYNVSGCAYIALGRTSYLTMISCARLVALFAMLPLGNALFGVQGAYWAVALHLALVVPLYLYLDHRHNLMDLKREALLLLTWPAGFGVGWIVSMGFGKIIAMSTSCGGAAMCVKEMLRGL